MSAHVENKPCLHCAVMETIQKAANPSQANVLWDYSLNTVIADVGQVLAEFLASIDDRATRRKIVAQVARELPDAVREARAEGRFPRSVSMGAPQ